MTKAKSGREAFGAYVRRLRHAQDLTQNQLGKAAGFGYYTMVSQIESGTSRCPPDRLAALAAALKMNYAQFADEYLKCMHNEIWQMFYSTTISPTGDTWE